MFVVHMTHIAELDMHVGPYHALAIRIGTSRTHCGSPIRAGTSNFNKLMPRPNLQNLTEGGGPPQAV